MQIIMTIFKIAVKYSHRLMLACLALSQTRLNNSSKRGPKIPLVAESYLAAFGARGRVTCCSDLSHSRMTFLAIRSAFACDCVCMCVTLSTALKLDNKNCCRRSEIKQPCFWYRTVKLSSPKLGD